MLITKEGMESEVEESLYPHPPPFLLGAVLP